MIGESLFYEILERQNTKVRYLLALTVVSFLVKNSTKDSLGSSPSLPEVLKPEVSLFAGMGRTAP